MNPRRVIANKKTEFKDTKIKPRNLRKNEKNEILNQNKKAL
jgi:hypothetical protein